MINSLLWKIYIFFKWNLLMYFQERKCNIQIFHRQKKWNNWKKFNLRPDKEKNVFLWKYSKHDEDLFRIGVNDIIVKKPDTKISLYQDVNSSFDYNGIENALEKRSGLSCVDFEKLLVIQMCWKKILKSMIHFISFDTLEKRFHQNLFVLLHFQINNYYHNQNNN